MRHNSKQMCAVVILYGVLILSLLLLFGRQLTSGETERRVVLYFIAQWSRSRRCRVLVRFRRRGGSKTRTASVRFIVLSPISYCGYRSSRTCSRFGCSAGEPMPSVFAPHRSPNTHRSARRRRCRRRPEGDPNFSNCLQKQQQQ